MHPTTRKWRKIRKSIGNNIRHYRTVQKFTLKKLSDLSGLPTNLIDNYELGKGELRLHALIKIAMAMQIDVRNLFERS